MKTEHDQAIVGNLTRSLATLFVIASQALAQTSAHSPPASRVAPLSGIARKDGTILSNAKILSFDGEVFQIEHDEGVAKIKWDDLPEPYRTSYSRGRPGIDQFKVQEMKQAEAKAAAAQSARETPAWKEAETDSKITGAKVLPPDPTKILVVMRALADASKRFTPYELESAKQTEAGRRRVFKSLMIDPIEQAGYDIDNSLRSLAGKFVVQDYTQESGVAIAGLLHIYRDAVAILEPLGLLKKDTASALRKVRL